MIEAKKRAARILIVDDEPMNITIIARRLQRRDFEVIEALDGAEGVARVRQMHEERDGLPNVVLMDINMPVMNGFEATKILKDEFPILPIIAVTAYAVEGLDFEGAGFCYLCRKPVDFEDLLNKILEVQLPLQ